MSSRLVKEHLELQRKQLMTKLAGESNKPAKKNTRRSRTDALRVLLEEEEAIRQQRNQKQRSGKKRTRKHLEIDREVAEKAREFKRRAFEKELQSFVTETEQDFFSFNKKMLMKPVKVDAKTNERAMRLLKRMQKSEYAKRPDHSKTRRKRTVQALEL